MYPGDAAWVPVCCGGAITGFAASPGNIRHLPDRRRFDIGWFGGMILKPAGTKPLASVAARDRTKSAATNEGILCKA
jgi:hypothetical protein